MADITLVEGNNVLNVGLVPIPPPVANLYGKVTDAQTGYPLEGVKVSIDDLVMYTDASGNYGFEELTPGTYEARFEKDGYETATGDVTLVEGGNEVNVALTPIVVLISGTIDLVWRWYEGGEWELVWAKPAFEHLVVPGAIPLNGEITLSVVWTNTSEVAIVGHVDIVVTYPDGTTVTPPATTGQDLEELPGGAGPITFGGAFLATQEGTYTVVATLSSAGEILASVTFTLTTFLVVANLYGVVTDAETGSPLSEVKVTIDSLVTYTDAGGNYSFTGLSPGSYTITFEKDGYETLVR